MVVARGLDLARHLFTLLLVLLVSLVSFVSFDLLKHYDQGKQYDPDKKLP